MCVSHLEVVRRGRFKDVRATDSGQSSHKNKYLLLKIITLIIIERHIGLNLWHELHHGHLLVWFSGKAETCETLKTSSKHHTLVKIHTSRKPRKSAQTIPTDVKLWGTKPFQSSQLAKHHMQHLVLWATPTLRVGSQSLAFLPEPTVGCELAGQINILFVNMQALHIGRRWGGKHIRYLWPTLVLWWKHLSIVFRDASIWKHVYIFAWNLLEPDWYSVFGVDAKLLTYIDTYTFFCNETQMLL